LQANKEADDVKAWAARMKMKPPAIIIVGFHSERERDNLIPWPEIHPSLTKLKFRKYQEFSESSANSANALSHVIVRCDFTVQSLSKHSNT
jgi:hypothetical protein